MSTAATALVIDHDDRNIVADRPANVPSAMTPMDMLDRAIASAVVRVWTAKSQSAKAMGAKDFQRSKQDVLDFCDDLLGVERGETARNQAA